MLVEFEKFSNGDRRQAQLKLSTNTVDGHPLKPLPPVGLWGTPLSISGQWVSYDWYDDNDDGQEWEGKKQLFYEKD